MTKKLHRCTWADSDPLLCSYHDEEWGVPDFDSRSLWERLMLEGFQAGLSWLIVLRKREAFQEVFQQFDPLKVARFGEDDIDRLMADPRIIRARAKIQATIGGARAYLEMKDAGVDFSSWAWDFVEGRPLQGAAAHPGPSALAETISKELKRRGFKFVGPVIVYAWMQAAGLINDHTRDCFWHDFCARQKRKKSP